MDTLLQTPALAWTLFGACALLAMIWGYLWLFHHRFWSTHIEPPVQPDCTARTDDTARTAPTGNTTQTETAPPAKPHKSAPLAAAAPSIALSSPCRHSMPAVFAIVPARNEAEVIAQTVSDILQQDYAGDLHLIVVNDNSEDATATIATEAARKLLCALANGDNAPNALSHERPCGAPPATDNTHATDIHATGPLPCATISGSSAPANTLSTCATAHRGARHFTLLNAAPLPEGWSGKLWAVHQGVSLAETLCASKTGVTTPTVVTNATNATAATNAINTAAATNAASVISAASVLNNTCDANSTTNTSNSGAINHSAASPVAAPSQTYLWLTDADIAHEPQVLGELLQRALADNRALVSRMALLCTDTLAERFTIPAFVYFFQMLYPFNAIANERSGIHGAAGGCILLNLGTLQKAGGIPALRGALIDDCTLADHIARAGGRLWLELTTTSRSRRSYGSAAGVWNMIARTAYTQLHYSPLLLLGTVLGLLFVFWGPLVLTALGIANALGLAADCACLCTNAAATNAGTAGFTNAAATATATQSTGGTAWLLPAASALLGAAAFAIQCRTFAPMLRFYRQSRWRSVLLPLVATFYLSATLGSAWRYYRGKTGNWKGRVYKK